MAQSDKCPTLAQVMISRFVSLSPTSGSVLTAQSPEPTLDSVSPSPSLSLPCSCALWLALSLSLSKINNQKEKKKLGIFSPPHHSPEKGERLETELTTNHAYSRSFIKIPNVHTGFGKLPGWEYTEVLRGWGTCRGRGSFMPLSTSPAACISSIWMFICTLYHILLQ